MNKLEISLLYIRARAASVYSRYRYRYIIYYLCYLLYSFVIYSFVIYYFVLYSIIWETCRYIPKGED